MIRWFIIHLTSDYFVTCVWHYIQFWFCLIANIMQFYWCLCCVIIIMIVIYKKRNVKHIFIIRHSVLTDSCCLSFSSIFITYQFGCFSCNTLLNIFLQVRQYQILIVCMYVYIQLSLYYMLVLCAMLRTQLTATIDYGQRTLRTWQTLWILLEQVNDASVMAEVKLASEKLDNAWYLFVRLLHCVTLIWSNWPISILG